MRSSRENPTFQTALRELHILQAVTDPALTRATLSDFFHEVLIHLQSALSVDNLAILLFEPERQQLTLRAVQGPEDAVKTQVTVPYGVGFAGTIAASQAPLIVNNLATFPVENPFLREHFSSMAGVPLMTDEQIFGVFHVGTVRPRTFSHQDIYLLERIATRLTLAIERATLHKAERSAHQAESARVQELEVLLDAVADAVTVYDQRGHIIRANAAARHLWGFDVLPQLAHLSLEERLHQYQVCDIHGAPIPIEQLPPKRLLRGEKLIGAKALDMIIRRADGVEIIVTVTGSPLYHDNGQIVGAVCTVRDVTERLQSEQAVKAILADIR